MEDNWDNRLQYSGGIILAEIDESEPYSVDQAAIIYNIALDNFSLLTASGCSCWEGDYDEVVFNSLPELFETLRKKDVSAYHPSLKGIDELEAQALKAYKKYKEV